MRRSTILYISTLPILALGLWLILRVGSHLAAPPDLSGIWETPAARETARHRLRINQSGNYIRMTLDQARPVDFRVIRRTTQAGGGEQVQLKAAGQSVALQVNREHTQLTAVMTGDSTLRIVANRSNPIDSRPGPTRFTSPAEISQSLLHRLLDNPIAIVLVQVTLILALSRVMGVLFARLNQPQVVGEMVAGIMLGPSLFGLIFPLLAATIFPRDPASMAGLNILSQIGVIFFMFLIGLELDPKLIRNRGETAVVISHVSILAPFLLGAALTLFLYSRLFNEQMKFTSVALFMGASMSITAFPVLARILTERNLHKTPIGAITITCAAVDDVTAWCMLAFVVAVARATGSGPALMTALKAGLYVLIMFFVIRPFLRRLQAVHDRQGRLSQNVVAIIFLLTLTSAFATDAIGIHALFGAFLMGAIMPKGTQFVRTLSEKLEDYTVVLLLPLFFAFVGLRTQIGLLSSAPLWLYTLLIIFVACLGKFGGSTVASRACGLGWRESSAIGILMNTRGLMELVILNVGLELGVITPAVFAMMVLMALLTTALTTPVLQSISTEQVFGPAAERKPRRRGLFSILIPIADPRSGGPLLRLSEMLAGSGAGARVVALHLSRPVDRDAYRTGLNEPATPEGNPLRPLLEHAAKSHVQVEPLLYVLRDVADDIGRVAREQQIDLVLMGFHKSVLGRALLGGTVHRVLSGTPADVGVFVDRGFLGAQRVLVPYLGGTHDRLALELAGRLARNAQARITVLHVVPPRRDAGQQLDARGAVDRVFNDPTQPAPVEVKVVTDASPVDAVLRTAREYDIVIVGVSEQWGLSSHLFGLRAERIAANSPVSMLIVRKDESKVGARSTIERDDASEDTDAEPAVATRADP